MSDEHIYLDHHATTPVDPRVVEVMLPHFSETYGNAASRSHAFGWQADRAVERARMRVAELIRARGPREIVFTSGATESNNLAIRGALEAAAGDATDLAGLHVVTSAIEHPCVMETCRTLQRRGLAWTEVGVTSDGLVDPAEVEAAIRPETVLVSVMTVNNEVGTVQPIAELADIAHRHNVLFHTDAAQAAGRLPIDVGVGIDLLSLSAHKLYGPKGVGALYVGRRPKRVALAPQQTGGEQERGFRSGTVNVPGVVGFGKAAELAIEHREEGAVRLNTLRNELLSSLREGIPDLRVFGSMEERVAGNLMFAVPGVDSEAVLAAVPHIAASTGSACASGKVGGSYVLSAMGIPKDLARGSIRIGLGRPTTEAEVQKAAGDIVSAVRRIRRN